MKKIIYLLIAGFTFLFSGCDDVLDRPPKDDVLNTGYWLDEEKVRLYANSFYPYFFPGYNISYSTDYAPIRGFIFNDDVSVNGKQGQFVDRVPSSLGSASATSSPPAWYSAYNGPTWYFGWIRDVNIMLTNLESMKTSRYVTDEQYNHWSGIGRFFRALEYSRLVGTFGDVPYFEEVLNPNTTPKDILYKDRDSRDMVMDKVYDDFKYALTNVRESDGELYVNRYVVAAFIARWMLYEGTWQKYYYNNNEKAAKYLQFAADAADLIMQSGKYHISGDYRSLFTSDDLKGHPEMIYYRVYDTSLLVRHSVGSYSNGVEGQTWGANAYALRSYLCVDGEPWQNSSVANASDFSISQLIKTRDSRFEATFMNKPNTASISLLYGVKFCARANVGSNVSPYTGAENVNDAPIMRYSEVLLNWIEAKAELASLGSAAVTQANIDISINAIRDRELAPQAIQAGVTKTAHLSLANLPDDPARDADVSPLIWEIRRERRMELMYEHSRLLDLRRWKKLEYMDNALYPDYRLGAWLNIPSELPALVGASYIEKTKVVKLDGTEVTYNGTNAADMVGFYVIPSATPRDPFTERVYLSPIGEAEINLYKMAGYTLSQTKDWQQ